jgi:hypothetical protein
VTLWDDVGRHACESERRVVALTVPDREAILRTLEDCPDELAEFRGVLPREHESRRREGLVWTTRWSECPKKRASSGTDARLQSAAASAWAARSGPPQQSGRGPSPSRSLPSCFRTANTQCSGSAHGFRVSYRLRTGKAQHRGRGCGSPYDTLSRSQPSPLPLRQVPRLTLRAPSRLASNSVACSSESTSGAGGKGSSSPRVQLSLVRPRGTLELLLAGCETRPRACTPKRRKERR